MIVFHPNPCYNVVCNRGTALYEGIIFRQDIESYPHFSAKNLIVLTLWEKNLIARQNVI